MCVSSCAGQNETNKQQFIQQRGQSGGSKEGNRRQSVSQLGHSFNALTHAVSVSLSSTAPATASELLGQSSLCLSLSLLLPLPARTFCGRLYIIHMSRQQCHSPSLFVSWEASIFISSSPAHCRELFVWPPFVICYFLLVIVWPADLHNNNTHTHSNSYSPTHTHTDSCLHNAILCCRDDCTPNNKH